MNMSVTESKILSEHTGEIGTTLQDLLQDVDFSVVQQGNVPISKIRIVKATCDSRCVSDSSLFIALVGSTTDGHRFVEEGSKNGCSVIVVEHGADWRIDQRWDGVLLEVADTHAVYATIAENMYGRPAEEMQLIGITGTNGKTTVSYLVEDVLEQLGHKVGVIGTVNYRYMTEDGKRILPAPYTTPEPMQLQALLKEMVLAGVEYVIMEVSSHALDQARVGNLRFNVAIFTNLSHDHLDYHVTMEEYFQAKIGLFTDHLQLDGKAVISYPQQPAEGGDWPTKMVDVCRQNDISVKCCGPQPDADVRILKYTSTLSQTEIELMVDGANCTTRSPLVGHFNVDNFVTAFTLLRGLGFQSEEVLPCLSRSTGAPGRLERVVVDDGTRCRRPEVFVDYAHTPDALEQVLKTVQALPHRELYCVFGCGGDRDASKRPLMGKIAGRYSDVVVVTDDNPRTEEPAAILEQIVPGVKAAEMERKEAEWLSSRNLGERGFVVIGDRSDAIAQAVKTAGPEDIVVIAGKGHEKYQLGATGKRYFDDVLEARTSLLDWNIHSVALATAGEVVSVAGGERFGGSVSTDSRTIGKGDIFLPLVGDRFDGHDFLADVTHKGAACLLVDRSKAEHIPGEVSVVVVDDTLQALADLAKFRRRVMRLAAEQTVVAITGSCGKTTVKEMTGAILRHKWPMGPKFPEGSVLQTKGNLNNLIGLPLSLLPLTPRQHAVVLEMGMNVPGEIARMARAAEPDVCCITNVHGVHLEGLETIEGVAAAKEELFREAGSKATLVINLDDPLVRVMAAGYGQRQLTFSTSSEGAAENADIRVSNICFADTAFTFTLHCLDESVEVTLHTVGMHNVSNAVCAAAIATAAGASPEEIAAGLADFRAGDRRMVQTATPAGLNILNDTYNANPASMEAGLRTLIGFGQGRTVALLGDMLELGEVSAQAHRRLGEQAGELGVDFLGVVGQFKDEVVRGAISKGMTADRVRSFTGKDKAAEWIENLKETGELTRGDWLLVKASRGLQMETIVARLTGKT